MIFYCPQFTVTGVDGRPGEAVPELAEEVQRREVGRATIQHLNTMVVFVLVVGRKIQIVTPTTVQVSGSDSTVCDTQKC